MVYTDSNGMVLIDDAAVAKDVLCLTSARDSLTDIKKTLEGVVAINQTMSGSTADSIDSNVQLLLAQVRDNLDLINNTVNALESAVNKYKNLDSSYR